MATIRSQMVLNDGMSAVLKRITSALDTTLNAFEQVQRASGRAVDAAQIAQARSQLVGANAEIQEMADGYRRAAEQEENLNRGLRTGGSLADGMHIVVADASVVSFTITPALDTVSRAEMESALAEHNTNGTSHSDIRALALNAVQQGDVYTKPEVNALVGGAVNEHNNSDTAHASIRVDLTGLDSRLKTLELKYGTNVTGSSFEVTFVTLTDVVVTGVWNEELGRIEF